MRTILAAGIALTGTLFTGCHDDHVAVRSYGYRSYHHRPATVSARVYFDNERPYYYSSGRRHWGYPVGYRHTTTARHYRSGYDRDWDDDDRYVRRSGSRRVVYVDDRDDDDDD